MGTHVGDVISKVEAPAEVTAGVAEACQIKYSAPQSGKILVKSVDEHLFRVTPKFIAMNFGDRQTVPFSLTISFVKDPASPCRIDFVLRNIRYRLELKVKQP
jgi:hypothetical protein